MLANHAAEEARHGDPGAGPEAHRRRATGSSQVPVGGHAAHPQGVPAVVELVGAW